MAGVPNTPEQQAAIDAMNAKMAGVFGQGSDVAKNFGNQIQGEVDTSKAMTGQGQDTKFMYGGWAGGADEAARRYQAEGAAAEGRQGVQLNLANSNESRGNQASIADMMRQRATGQTPSIAGMVGARDMNRVAAEQTSAAASARGPASLALAQQGAAANTAAGQSTISNHTQINSAQERLAAEQAAMGAYSGMRGQDIGQSTAQGNLDAQQRGLNDQFKLGMTGYETGVQGAQLGAQRAQVAQAAQGAAQYQQIAAQRQAASDAKTGQMVGTVAQVGGTIVGSALGGPVGGAIGGAAGKAAGGAVSPGSVADGSGSNVPLPNYNQQSQGDPNDPYREHGGPVRAGKPYIVGERGPEMIVPERDGHVLTAEQTREATGGAGHGSRADAFLEGIHPLSYFYKHGDAEPRSEPTGGRYLGISAQDLEHVPDVGHQLVSDGPRGKQIESGPTLSAALAGLARLHERVKELEGGGEHITSDIRAKEDVVSEGRAPSPDALRAAYAAGAAREMNRDNPAGRPELPEYMQPRAAAPPSLARAYEAPRPAQPAEIRQTRPTRLESLRDTAAEMAGGVGGFLRETGAAVRDLPANLASFYRDDYPADHEPPPQREPAVMPGGPVASYRVGR